MKFNKSKEWLIEEYVIKNRPRLEIADECGLTLAGLKSVLSKFNIKKEKLNLSKELLEILINKNYNHSLIEKELNIGLTTLYRYLRKYNLSIKEEANTYSRYDDTNDMLICQLYMDGFSTTEIGKEFGISHRTVINHLAHCGITRRSLIDSHWNIKEYPNEFSSYDTMYDLYITQLISKKDLAVKFNCDPSVIDRVLRFHEIPIRNNSESKIGLMTGDKHWNWQNGITPLGRRLREYFSTNQTLKVLLRDHYCCLLCGSKHNLHIHHINSFSNILHNIISNNPGLTNDEYYNIAIHDKNFLDLNNLITYCKDCHFYKVHKYLQADSKPCELLEA